MRPMNASTFTCGDTLLGCSCGDCPSSAVCSTAALPGPHKKGSYSVRIGSVNAKCIEVAMTVLYIILVSFLGWGFFHRKRKRSPVSRTKPLINIPNGGIIRHINSQKDENVPMQMLEDVPQINSGVQLSIVQGYMSKFYRRYALRYGTWVARNPVLVLCSSIGIILVLCLGLIRYPVETRPEKLWVGPGSRAAKEKQFFDSHLAPFYRIEHTL